MTKKQDPLAELRTTVESVIQTLGSDATEKSYSTQELAHILGYSPNKVLRLLKQADALGWLQRVPRQSISLDGRRITTTGYNLTKK